MRLVLLIFCLHFVSADLTHLFADVDEHWANNLQENGLMKRTENETDEAGMLNFVISVQFICNLFSSFRTRELVASEIRTQ